MGKLLILTNYIFLIYGSDLYESRRHIHVTFNHRGFKKSCKFWPDPEILLDDNKKGNFTPKELREIEFLLMENVAIIRQQLDLFYLGKPLKAIRK